MNSQYLMPFDSIAKNVIKDGKTNFSYLSGTGFFVYFPPFEDYIFYVTARHCCIKALDSGFDGSLLIDYASFNHLDYSIFGKVPFSQYIEINESNEGSSLEDIIIFIVDNEISLLKKQILLNRALKLSHAIDVNSILEILSHSKENGKVRIIGFPSESETELLYDESGENVSCLKLHPRGLNGWLEESSHGIYHIVDTNWREETLKGFSGSPVLAVFVGPALIDIRVIGIVIAGYEAKKIIKFVSINCVTQAVAQFLYEKGYLIPIEE